MLYFVDCPNWQLAEARLSEAAVRFGLDVSHRLISTADDAEAAGFIGSPTIRIDGIDPFANGTEKVGLTCRLYATPDGLAGAPTIEQIEAALGFA